MAREASVVVSWSGGKDSALALRAALADPGLAVGGLVTTVTAGYERVSMHGVRTALLAAQAEAVGLPLRQVRIPPGATNELYESAMSDALRECREAGVTGVVFGDLFLEDVRRYRERLVGALDLEPLFPLWHRDTAALAAEFAEAGFRAVVVCVDPRQVDAGFCGREYDSRFVADLPPSADRCGERGEFHTFVYDGPIFRRPVGVRRGEVVERDGFVFCDLVGAAAPTAPDGSA
jgi:uncharacterized protein (TIGR00290 family)